MASSSHSNFDWQEIKKALLHGAVAGLLLGAAFAGGFFYHNLLNKRTPLSDTSFQLLQEADGILASDYLFELPSEEARIHGAVGGLVASLNDPYTYFVEPQTAEIDQNNLAGRFGGIGVEIAQGEQGQFRVVNVYRDNPAQQAGVRQGDLIVAVDGIPFDTGTQDMNALISAIRGEIGTPVELTLERDGERFDVTVDRAEVLIPSVFWRILEEDSRVGYIQITRFTDRTPEELTQAVDELSADRAGSYILDLRDNGGGLVDSAVTAAGTFLNGGVVLYEERADGSERVFNASRGGPATDVPLALLVNGGTASASEIVAGALRDRDRAVLIGEQTFGKGTVQVIRSLSDGSSLRVTTAQWFTPERDPIEGAGLTPDVEIAPVADSDAALGAAVEYMQDTLENQ